MLATALSLGSLNFTSHALKPVKLTLTPHHLFYLLSRFEELGIPVGPMNVRLESLHADASPANYVSFLSQSQRSKGRSDRDSLHSVSSVHSVMSSVSSLWSSVGLGSGSSVTKSEKTKAQLVTDSKYLYSAFTKIPCLRLSPDRRARMIRGYEEFPFDTAVPLIAFKNLGALEICDIDFRQFYGWDRLAEQLRSLTIKRAHLDDPGELLIGIVLDDMDKRRRRSSKNNSSPMLTWPPSPYPRFNDIAKAGSAPGSPIVDDKTGHSVSPRKSVLAHTQSEIVDIHSDHSAKGTIYHRPQSSRLDHSFRHSKSSQAKFRRSGSGSSNSSDTSTTDTHQRAGSSLSLRSAGILPGTKWRFLRHLSLADNALTSMNADSLAPLANTLYSLDLSSNLFAEMPDSLVVLSALRSLNMANCMIENLHGLARNPLPAITALNLRANRLASIAGIERLLPLERLDLRENRLHDPMEIARLTGIPEMREIWVLHNPLVKSHGDYRVTMFNLFRGTPGYTEDIIIDSSGPNYSERRQLRERVAESDPVPVVKPLPLEQPLSSIPSRGNTGPMGSEIAMDYSRPLLQESQSEFAITPTKRRRGPRRRIVDLATDQAPPIIHQDDGSAKLGRLESGGETDSSSPMPGNKDLGNESMNGPTAPNLIRSQTERAPETHSQALRPTVRTLDTASPTTTSIPQKPKAPDLDSDAYRRRVEALKREVGSDWLRVLNEQSLYHNNQADSSNNRYKHYDASAVDILPFRAPTTEVVGTGRTLG